MQEGEAALYLAISFSTLPVDIAFLFNRTEFLTQIAWHTNREISKPRVFQSFPGQPLVSKKHNGYFSVLFFKCHLSDGKLRPILVDVFTITSGTKRWFSQVTSPCTPTHKAVALKCKTHSISPVQEHKRKIQCQTHSHWIRWQFGHWCHTEQAGSALSPGPQKRGNEIMHKN